MKIIEAMKRIKDLQVKATDLRAKIAQHSAHLNLETPMYPDQKKQVSEWLQAHADIMKEVMKLRVGIQRTNLETKVAIELGGKSVTKTVAEWIHRRRDLAKLDLEAWGKLTDRSLREGFTQQSDGQQREVKIVRCYDPAERDRMVDLYRGEPSVIDSTLEVTNAVTDIIE